MKSYSVFFIISHVFFQLSHIQARVLTKCEAAKELKKGGISNTFISNWVCLMDSESNLNTGLIKGPGSMSSYSFGVFQISSIRWCKRGRKGGECNAKCEDFANDIINDDIVCAKHIFDTQGFKYWQGWTKKCKNKPLPSLDSCKIRRDINNNFESFFQHANRSLV